jgi:hypothetical protein
MNHSADAVTSLNPDPVKAGDVAAAGAAARPASGRGAAGPRTIKSPSAGTQRPASAGPRSRFAVLRGLRLWPEGVLPDARPVPPDHAGVAGLPLGSDLLG